MALLASYAVVVGVMHAITRRLFPVPYEWGRLTLAVGAAAALIAVGDTVVPHDGLDGLALTLALCAAYPVVLLGGGFLTREERERLRPLVSPGAIMERMGSAGGAEQRGTQQPRPDERHRGPQLTREALEQAERDSDRGGSA